MPLDYAVHPLLSEYAPALPLKAGQAGLAEAADSAIIATDTNGAVIALVATVKLRVDLQLVDPTNEAVTIPALAPATSPMVLLADQRAMLYLRPGRYRLRTSVYA